MNASGYPMDTALDETHMPVEHDQNWNSETFSDWTYISCTTVFIPQDGLPRNLQSHIFPSIPIRNCYLGIRSGGSYSVLVGSILHALRTSLLMGTDLVPRNIANAITGGPGSQHVDMATTRVPLFFDSMCSPSHGYQILGQLSRANIQLTPLPLHFDYNRELLAIKKGNTLCQEYIEMWSPMPLIIDTHFILIFSHPTSSSQNSSPSVASSLLARRDLSTVSTSRLGPIYSPSPPIHTPSPPIHTPSPLFHTPSPPFHTPSLPFHTPSPPPTTSISRIRSIAPSVALLSNDAHRSNMDSTQPVLDGSNNMQPVFGTTSEVPLGENDLLPNVQHSHNNSTGVATIDTLCAGFGIMPDAIAAAKCHVGDKDKSLLAMVLHHRAMVHILVTLGYHDQNNPFAKGKIIQFSGGLEFSAENILRSFGWAVDTYKNKLKWYSWAEDVASHSEWDESTGRHPTLYNIWLGIKYFWGPSGPLQAGRWRGSSEDEAEKAARSLTQHQIDKNLTVLDGHLRQLQQPPSSIA